MRRWLVVLPLLLLTPLAAVACSGGLIPTPTPPSSVVVTPTPPPATDLGSWVTLAPGDSIAVRGEGLILKFLEVVSDSRCPQGVQCVQAGLAHIKLGVTLNGQIFSVEITEQGGATEGANTIGAYTLRYNLLPYPAQGKTINPSDYRLTLQVNQAQPNKTPSADLGTLHGQVSIGPLQPVQQQGVPTPTPSPSVYATRKVIVTPKDGSQAQSVTIGPDGKYSVSLPPGSYVVDINHAGIDSSNDVPKTIQITAGQATTLNISIDTGIR